MSSKTQIEAVSVDVLQDSKSAFRYYELANASAPPASDTNMRHCETGALTNGLGLFVQLLLAFIAFSCLIAKRYCEPVNRRRTWIVWFLDTSKQIVGAGAMHAANVLLSEVLYAGDPCTWYIVNFLLDSTIGLGVIFIGLRAAYQFGKWMTWDSLRFGQYGDPARMAVWAKQCSVYLLVILVEKSVIVLLTLLPIWRRLTRYAMDWTTSADLELVLVMFIIPLVVNAIIFWVVDNFLMQHKFGDFTPRGHVVSAHQRLRPCCYAACLFCSSCPCLLPLGCCSRRSGPCTVKYSRLTGQQSRPRRWHRQLRRSAASGHTEDAGDEYSSDCDFTGALDHGADSGNHGGSLGGGSADPAVLLLPPSPSLGSETWQPQRL